MIYTVLYFCWVLERLGGVAVERGQRRRGYQSGKRRRFINPRKIEKDVYIHLWFLLVLQVFDERRNFRRNGLVIVELRPLAYTLVAA